MSPADFLPPRCGLALTAVTDTPQLLALAVRTTAPTAACPQCGSHSDHVHSRYSRHLADRPLGLRRFLLRVSVRRFFCRRPGCSRHIFCERLTHLASAHARTTDRLHDLHRIIGFAVGGEPGSRLAEKLAAPTSGDTLLRRVRATPDEPEPAYRFVGIDDFALRKGQVYGTILVDLERGQVIDIFTERDGSAIEVWLKAHPQVEVVTRDRWPAYANAATAGAPNATQVADRFHLVMNLREVIERVFDVYAAELDAALEPPTPTPEPVPAVESPTPTPAEPPVPPGPAMSPRRQRRQERFEEVRRRRASGMSLREIAREMGMTPRTVLNYSRRDHCPDWNAGATRPCRLDRYREVVDGYLAGGGRNAAELSRQLQHRGCRSSYAAVQRYLNRRLQAGGITRSRRATPGVPRRPSSRQLSFEYVRRAENRSGEQSHRMEVIGGIATLSEELELVDEFLGMARKTVSTPLSGWLIRVDQSSSAALQGFAASLRSDESAVAAGLTTEWSNGPVEGQVNRLKTLKRGMYGRAGFDLLRARVRRKR